jgi:hypothetical protein
MIQRGKTVEKTGVLCTYSEVSITLPVPVANGERDAPIISAAGDNFRFLQPGLKKELNQSPRRLFD